MTSAYSRRNCERVRAFVHLVGARNEVISKQGVAAGGVDQNVSRLEHRDRVLRRHDGSGALHHLRPARIDEIADRALDGVERTEPQRPVPQECHQIRGNGLPEREALLELWRIEDGMDAVSVDRIGTVGLDRVRHEVRGELNHPGPRVLVPLLV